MNKKNLLNSIKALFAEVSKMGFSEALQEDGSTIQYTVLEVGAPVFVSDGEGSIPAPNGEYKIDENTSIVVEDGAISEVLSSKVDEPAPEAPAQDEFVEDTPEQVEDKVENIIEDVPEQPSLEDVVSALADTLKVVTEKIQDFESRIKALEDGSASKEDIDALQEGFSKLAKTPAQPSKVSKLKGLPNEDLKNMPSLQSAFTKLSKK